MSTNPPDTDRAPPCTSGTPVPPGREAPDLQTSPPTATGRGVITTGTSELPTASIGPRTVKSSALSKKFKEEYAVEGDGQLPMLAGLSVQRQPVTFQKETMLFEVSTRAVAAHKTHRELPKGSRHHSYEAVGSVSPHSGLVDPASGLRLDHRSSEFTSRSQETVKGEFRRLLSRQLALEKLPVTGVSPATPAPAVQDRRHRKLQKKSPTTSVDARGWHQLTETSPMRESQQNLTPNSGSATATRSVSPVLRRQMGNIDLTSPEHPTWPSHEGVKRQGSNTEDQRLGEQTEAGLEPSLPSDVGVNFLIRSLYPADFLSTLRSPSPNRTPDKNKMNKPLSRTPDTRAPQACKSPEQRSFSPTVTTEEGVGSPHLLSPKRPDSEFKADIPVKPPPPKKEKAKPVVQGNGAPPEAAALATPKQPILFQKKTKMFEVTAQPVPVHKKPRKHRNDHRSFEAVGSISPPEARPDHRSSEISLSRRPSRSQDALKGDFRGRLLRQPGLEQLPVMPPPVPTVGPPATARRRHKDRRVPRDLPGVSPEQEQQEPGDRAPERIQVPSTRSTSTNEPKAVKRAPSALRRRMGSTDLTVAHPSIPARGIKASWYTARRHAIVPDHDFEDTIRLAAESKDHKLPFPVPSDIGAGFLFESPVESSRSMVAPIAPVRRFRPTRTLSLPDLSDDSLMLSPEFLRSRQVLKTDDTVYLPYILRKEYVIRTKLRVMFRLLRPEPPRLIRSYSEGYITAVTFLNEYQDRLGALSDGDDHEESEWRVEEGCNFFSLCQLHVKCCRKKPRGYQHPPKVQFA